MIYFSFHFAQVKATDSINASLLFHSFKIKVDLENSHWNVDNPVGSFANQNSILFDVKYTRRIFNTKETTQIRLKPLFKRLRNDEKINQYC